MYMYIPKKNLNLLHEYADNIPRKRDINTCTYKLKIKSLFIQYHMIRQYTEKNLTNCIESPLDNQPMKRKHL